MLFYLNRTMLNHFQLINQEYLITDRESSNTDPCYELEPGKAEYRLYSYMSTLFNGTTILDIGTNLGRSAIALSHNLSNQVISYDIEDHIKSKEYRIFRKPNIEFRLKNVLDDLTPAFLENVKLVMIDICHTGPPERVIMDKLWECGFRGVVLLDDIWHPEQQYRDGMQKMWTELPWRKYDITGVGHWSGTGLVVMNEDDEVVIDANP